MKIYYFEELDGFGEINSGYLIDLDLIVIEFDMEGRSHEQA